MASLSESMPRKKKPVKKAKHVTSGGLFDGNFGSYDHIRNNKGVKTSYLDELDKNICTTHGDLSASITQCLSLLEQRQIDHHSYSPQIYKKLEQLKKLIQEKLPIMIEKEENCNESNVKCPICRKMRNRFDIISHIKEKCTISRCHSTEAYRGNALFIIGENGITCRLCDVHMKSYEVMNSHEFSPKHIQSLGCYRHPIRVYMFCVLCQTRVLKTIHSYKKHVGGKLHKKLIKWKPHDWNKKKVGVLLYQNYLRCLPCATDIPLKPLLMPYGRRGRVGLIQQRSNMQRLHSHDHSPDLEKAFCTLCLKNMPFKDLLYHARSHQSTYRRIDGPIFTCPLCLTDNIEVDLKSHLQSCIAVQEEPRQTLEDNDEFAINPFDEQDVDYAEAELRQRVEDAAALKLLNNRHKDVLVRPTKKAKNWCIFSASDDIDRMGGVVVDPGQELEDKDEAALDASSVVGDSEDEASHDASIVAGDSEDEAALDASIVAGDSENEASHDASIVAGDSEDEASHDASIVAGDSENEASHDASIVVGDSEDEAALEASIVIGDSEDEASHDASIVVGDSEDEAAHDPSIVVTEFEDEASLDDLIVFSEDEAALDASIVVTDSSNALIVFSEDEGALDASIVVTDSPDALIVLSEDEAAPDASIVVSEDEVVLDASIVVADSDKAAVDVNREPRQKLGCDASRVPGAKRSHGVKALIDLFSP